MLNERMKVPEKTSYETFVLTLTQHFEMCLTIIFFFFVGHSGISQKTVIFHGTVRGMLVWSLNLQLQILIVSFMKFSVVFTYISIWKKLRYRVLVIYISGYS